jgi:rhodanese-related sulfurtransferase
MMNHRSDRMACSKYYLESIAFDQGRRSLSGHKSEPGLWCQRCRCWHDAPMSRVMKQIVPAILGVSLLAACGSSDSTSDDGTGAPAGDEAAIATAFTLVSPEEAAATIADPPEDLVILDVRTPEEFAEGHIEGAVTVDFYSDSFDAELAALDPDVPYVVYCQSGNRSGQTITKMEQIGFQSVEDIDGGVVAWAEAGLPLVN